MGKTTTKNVAGALVYHDVKTTICGGNRWYDAFGPGVVKYLNEFSHLPVDDQTHDPHEFTLTITETGAGDSTAVVTDVAGGALLITTDALEDDGYAMQLGHGHGGVGENVDLSSAFPTYFGIEFALNDVTQTDCLFGLCVTDTDCIGAVTDGIYFRKVDGATTLNFVVENTNAEDETAAATLVADTYVTAEFYFNGTDVKAYINGTLVATVLASNTDFPDDELLRLTMELLTGDDSANTCTIKWVRLIHIRGA